MPLEFTPHTPNTPDDHTAVTPPTDTITVPRPQLAQVLQQNKELKHLVSSSAEIIGFIINNVFGGSIPKEFSVMEISRIAIRLPKIVKQLDADTLNNLKINLDDIKALAPMYMTPEQQKRIQTNE